MSVVLKSMRLLTDHTRIRLILLLEQGELSVAELQEILAKGQSQISMHLSQLRQTGLVEDRRTGKNIFYRLKVHRGEEGKALAQLLDLLRKSSGEIAAAEHDRAALKLVLRKRRDKMRSYFDGLAGKFGREYLPGRSWQGLAEALLGVMQPMVIADLGAGEGTFSQLLARRARQVIAIDKSEKMAEFGSRLARQHGLRNLEYRVGDMEAVPIGDSEVDLAFFSQSLHHTPQPAQAIGEAWRILKPGGQIVILDLLRHQFERARELYADLWLGFTEVELQRFLKKQGFQDVRVTLVHRESEAPHFETLLAVARKPEIPARHRVSRHGRRSDSLRVSGVARRRLRGRT